MHWKIKAFLQKLLSTSRLGDKINHLYGSFQKNYYSDGVTYGFNELFYKLDLINNYQVTFKEIPNKIALEIGTGYFIVQPIILKLLGWNQIITVDITRDLNYNSARKQLNYLLQDRYISIIKRLSSHDSNKFSDIIEALKTSTTLEHIFEKCNIIYLAPYSFKDIEEYGIKFDFIFSQVVLEHIPPNTLRELFSYSKKWLKDNGYIVHIVNFTDHFTNPGLFGDKKISEFNFLQYSDKFWHFWAGNSIAHVNRLGYPFYYQLCMENNFKVSKFIVQNYKERKPFSIAKIHQDIISQYNHVNLDELIKVQRGAFLIEHR